MEAYTQLEGVILGTPAGANRDMALTLLQRSLQNALKAAVATKRKA